MGHRPKGQRKGKIPPAPAKNPCFGRGRHTDKFVTQSKISRLQAARFSSKMPAGWIFFTTFSTSYLYITIQSYYIALGKLTISAFLLRWGLGHRHFSFNPSSHYLGHLAHFTLGRNPNQNGRLFKVPQPTIFGEEDFISQPTHNEVEMKGKIPGLKARSRSINPRRVLGSNLQWKWTPCVRKNPRDITPHFARISIPSSSPKPNVLIS